MSYALYIASKSVFLTRSPCFPRSTNQALLLLQNAMMRRPWVEDLLMLPPLQKEDDEIAEVRWLS